MMDSKTFQKEVVRMWDTVRNDLYKGDVNCNGVNCNQCPIHGTKHGCSSPLSIIEIYETVERWSKEHQQKHKVSQLEYDILEQYANCGFACYFLEYDLLMSLLKKGYFKGADEKMNIDYYFYHCEVA